MTWIPQARWAREQVDGMPGFVQREMLLRHEDLVGTLGPHSSSPFFEANQWLVSTETALRGARIGSAFDEAEIRDCAENFARLCAAMPQLAEREAFAYRRKIEPPPAKFLSDRYEARAQRLADPKWWRRKLRVAWTRSTEEGLRQIGLVRKGKATYASDSAVNHRALQKRQMQAYCEAHVAVNEVGEQLGLFDLQQHSISNPALRRGEFMTRVRGFEELATAFKHEAIFFTLTTPSHFHPQLEKGGANPRYISGETVRTAQSWLTKYWSHFRSALSRRKVLLYGFRIAEPHHDGTPHWHGLLFCRSTDVAFVREQLRKHFLKDHGDDPGARENRIQVVRVDAAKGSAAGYIAKYVSKNIDGAGTIGTAQSDESGEKIGDQVRRVDAWAATHGIRQFQQLGGPPVGLWREARRLREPTIDPDIEKCRLAADRGRFERFVRCVGGIHAGRRTNLRLLKEELGTRNVYGECRGAVTLGLKFASARVITRPHRWRIERKGRGDRRHDREGATSSGQCGSVVSGSGSSSESPSDLGPVAITVRLMPGPPTKIGDNWYRMAMAGDWIGTPWVLVDPPELKKSDHVCVGGCGGRQVSCFHIR